MTRHERLWYPPNSFEGMTHWEVETHRADGTYRVFTEHETQAAAEAQLNRMALRYPTHALRLQHVVVHARVALEAA